MQQYVTDIFHVDKNKSQALFHAEKCHMYTPKITFKNFVSSVLLNV